MPRCGERQIAHAVVAQPRAPPPAWRRWSRRPPRSARDPRTVWPRIDASGALQRVGVVPAADEHAHARAWRHARRRRVRRRHHVERRREREPPRVAREPVPPWPRAARGRASCTRTIAAARTSGSSDAATTPLRPSSTSSVAALSGAAHTTLGMPLGRGLHHDQAVALAPRGQDHAQRAARRAASTSSALAKPRQRHHAPQALARARAPPPGPLRAVAEDLAAQLRQPPRAPRPWPRTRPARASRGCGGRRTPPRAPRARGSAAGSSGPSYSPSSTVGSPRRPSSRSRPACRREKQNARWGTRTHRRCTAQPTGPAAAEVLAPVVARPHLVPVHHQPEAVQPPQGRGRQQREVRKGRGVHHVVARGRGEAGGRARPAPNTSGGQDAAPARPCRAPAGARPATTRTPGTSGALAAVPLAQGQVGHLVPVRRQALAEVAVPPLGAADRVGEQAVVDEADTHAAPEAARPFGTIAARRPATSSVGGRS